jgi:hypothetical protein
MSPLLSMVCVTFSLGVQATEPDQPFVYEPQAQSEVSYTPGGRVVFVSNSSQGASFNVSTIIRVRSRGTAIPKPQPKNRRMERFHVTSPPKAIIPSRVTLNGEATHFSVGGSDIDGRLVLQVSVPTDTSGASLLAVHWDTGETSFPTSGSASDLQTDGE